MSVFAASVFNTVEPAAGVQQEAKLDPFAVVCSQQQLAVVYEALWARDDDSQSSSSSSFFFFSLVELTRLKLLSFYPAPLSMTGLKRVFTIDDDSKKADLAGVASTGTTSKLDELGRL
jgi:hypothetical protein